MINRAIQSGIDYLEAQQQADGSFLSLSFTDATKNTRVLLYHTVFPTALILSCLNSLQENEQTIAIKQKAASFLLTQKSKHWSFNYWARKSKESRDMPYPDDLDDTFCSLSALYQYNPTLIDGEALAQSISLLTHAEVQEGGPYRTWLVPENAPDTWTGVDIVVNSNIGYFLSLLDITLPNLTALIDTALEKKQISSDYYPSSVAILYFISRFYRGENKNLLMSLLQTVKLNENPLQAALRASALLNYKADPKLVEKEILSLAQSQKKGAWQPYKLYKDPALHNVTYYAGSSALTTAFCLQALVQYTKAVTNEKQKLFKQNNNKTEKIHTFITKTVTKRFSLISPELKKQATITIETMLQGDRTKQITLLPYYFAKALETKHDLPEELLRNLGLANTYGWLAYTIYDDFLDGEGDPRQLSVGTIALREVTLLYRAVGIQIPEFMNMFNTIMDDLDGANAWEVTHCRIPVLKETIQIKENALPHFDGYRKLAQKSLGHALGPLAVLFLQGYTQNSAEIKNVLLFFTHYLIARQLNDDAHDWETDLVRGRITPVINLLLKQWQKEQKNGNKTILLPLVNTKLSEIFWYHTIISVSNLVLNHVQLARTYLQQVSCVKDPQPLLALLDPLDSAAKKALDEQKKTIAFLKNYDV